MIQRMYRWLRHEMPFIIAVPPFVWQALFVYVPLLLVIMYSVIETEAYQAWVGITLDHFAHVCDWVYAVVIGRSLLLAVNTALASLAIGYPVAYYIAFTSGRGAYVWLYLLIIPFWTNFLFHALAWNFILERQGVVNMLLQYFGIVQEPLHLLNTQFAVYVMMIYSYFPFMTLPIYNSLIRIPRQFLEVSYDLGASWTQTLWRVIVPLSMPGIRGGFFFVFIPAFGEFAIPELLGGDKTMYVGSVISHYILNAWTQSIGSAFTLVSATVLLLACVAIARIMRRVEGVAQ